VVWGGAGEGRGEQAMARKHEQFQRIAAIVLAMAVVVSLFGPAGTPIGTTAVRAAGNPGLGINVDAIGLDGPSKETMFRLLNEGHFGWIRQQLRWSSYETAKGCFCSGYAQQVDALVNAAAAHGIRVMFSVVNSPPWAGDGGGLPHNPADFGDLMRNLTSRYKGKVQAYEVWNEQNYAYETGGLVDIGSYLVVLKAGYQAVKSVDPSVTVIFGGLTPTGVRNHPEIAQDEVQYLRQIYAINGGEVRDYFDALGIHPYGTCNPPDSIWPDDPATTPCGTDPDGSRSFTNDNSFYFKRILDLRTVMANNDDGDKPVWVTEFGWSSTPNPAQTTKFARYVSEQQQADYITQALDIGFSYTWMDVMFVWNLNFQVTTQQQDEKWGFGILRPDWSPRPAFNAIKAMYN
jgi:hypothetical protein